MHLVVITQLLTTWVSANQLLYSTGLEMRFCKDFHLFPLRKRRVISEHNWPGRNQWCQWLYSTKLCLPSIITGGKVFYWKCDTWMTTVWLSAQQLQDNNGVCLSEADWQRVTGRSESAKQYLLQIITACCVLLSVAGWQQSWCYLISKQCMRLSKWQCLRAFGGITCAMITWGIICWGNEILFGYLSFVVLCACFCGLTCETVLMR